MLEQCGAVYQLKGYVVSFFLFCRVLIAEVIRLS